MTKATTVVPAAATTIASPTPSAQPVDRGGTRRRSASTGSREVRLTASQTTSTTPRGTTAMATTAEPGSSAGARPSRTTERARPATSKPAATPTRAPTSATGASSPTTARRAPRAPRPRSRASASSGRRCSTAAPRTNHRTTSASSPSCSVSSGTVMLACSRAWSTSSARSGSWDRTLPTSSPGASGPEASGSRASATSAWTAGPSDRAVSTSTRVRSRLRSTAVEGSIHRTPEVGANVAGATSQLSCRGWSGASGSTYPDSPVITRPAQ